MNQQQNVIKDTGDKTFIVKKWVTKYFHDKGYWINNLTLLRINEKVEQIMKEAIERTDRNRYVQKRIKPDAI